MRLRRRQFVLSIIVPLVAFAIFGRGLARNLIGKRIVEKVRQELTRQIVGDEDASVISKLKNRVDAFVRELVSVYAKNLDDYLINLDEQEKKVIADAMKAKADKWNNIKVIDKFREDVKEFVETAVQKLRELNPGKEPAHG